MKLQDVNFQKITETARLSHVSGLEFEAGQKQVRRLRNPYWNWMNSYWMFWIGCLRGARSVSSFLRFSKKLPFVISPHFSPFWHEKISFVFQIFLLMSIKAYLCPNMIDFDNVDFSERRPEEVKSFFWRSVYFKSALVLEVVPLKCPSISISLPSPPPPPPVACRGGGRQWRRHEGGRGSKCPPPPMIFVVVFFFRFFFSSFFFCLSPVPVPPLWIFLGKKIEVGRKMCRSPPPPPPLSKHPGAAPGGRVGAPWAKRRSPA